MGRRGKRQAGGGFGSSGGMDSFLSASTSGDNGDDGESSRVPLESRLQVGLAERQLISPYLLRKYIAYAREYVHPK